MLLLMIFSVRQDLGKIYESGTTCDEVLLDKVLLNSLEVGFEAILNLHMLRIILFEQFLNVAIQCSLIWTGFLNAHIFDCLPE